MAEKFGIIAQIRSRYTQTQHWESKNKNSMEREKLSQLVSAATLILNRDEKKNKKYIAFLEKHKLPCSGPTEVLFASLNQQQRVELVEIINPKNIK
jgi:hypothetical protein